MDINLKNLVNQLSSEAMAYDGLDNLRSIVKNTGGLQNVPVQPLYQAIRSLGLSEIVEIFPLLSKDQRQAIYDIDLWHKDDIEPRNFENWISVLSEIEDEKIKHEFLLSNEFALFFKGRFHISTFDVEDPEYPEHEYFFLTDDSLLLVEYDEEFSYVTELQNLIRYFYSAIGVEQAYSYLFKITSDSFLVMQETEYQEKRERLRDLGFVDYFDALEFISSFPSVSHIDHYIKNKSIIKSDLDAYSKNQVLDSMAISPFQKGLEFLDEEVSKISEQVRIEYLKFNFLKLVNSALTLDDALKTGKIAVNRVAKKSIQAIHLGFDYMLKRQLLKDECNFFDYFDFSELYRVGNSLITLEKGRLKKEMQKFGVGEQVFDAFLGQYWNEYLDNCYSELPRMKLNWGEQELDDVIDTEEKYKQWREVNNCFLEQLPFIKSFFKAYETLKKENQKEMVDFLNFKIEEVDYESILLTTFAGFYLKIYSEKESNVALKIDEFKSFYNSFFNSQGHLSNPIKLKESWQEFNQHFGLNAVTNLIEFEFALTKSLLTGYELGEVSIDEFKHIGGVIIIA